MEGKLEKEVISAQRNLFSKQLASLIHDQKFSKTANAWASAITKKTNTKPFFFFLL